MIETTNHMRYEIRLTFFYPDEYYEQFENMYYSSILVKAPSINKFDYFFFIKDTISNLKLHNANVRPKILKQFIDGMNCKSLVFQIFQ